MNSKHKGNRFEREWAKKLKPYFPDVLTSRYASREADDNGIDLVNTGDFKFQCKHIERQPNFRQVLNEIQGDGIKIVAHKMNNKGTIICMGEKDFLTLMETYINALPK